MLFSTGNVVFGLLYYLIKTFLKDWPNIDFGLYKEVIVDCFLNLLGGYVMILAF